MINKLKIQFISSAILFIFIFSIMRHPIHWRWFIVCGRENVCLCRFMMLIEFYFKSILFLFLVIHSLTRSFIRSGWIEWLLADWGALNVTNEIHLKYICVSKVICIQRNKILCQNFESNWMKGKKLFKNFDLFEFELTVRCKRVLALNEYHRVNHIITLNRYEKWEMNACFTSFSRSATTMEQF